MKTAERSEAELSMAHILCARLCHDLAGTVGALAGTLDMAATDHDPDALALAADCARELSVRLRLMRTAWGTLGEADPLSSLVAGLPGAERLRVDLADLAPLDHQLSRLAANLLLLAAQALPRGGAIRLSGDPACLSLTIEGVRAGWPAALGHCLADATELRIATDNPRDVGIAVTCLIAGQLGAAVALDGPTRLTVTAGRP